MTRKQVIFVGVAVATLGVLMSGVVSLAFSLTRRLLTTESAKIMASGDELKGIYSMAFVTVPDMQVAKKLAGEIVKSKLAACVNIIPSVTSVYEWEGKIENDNELLLMIKTRTSKVDELSAFVRANHPYDVAEVISSVITNGNLPYLKWIGESVPDGQ